MRCHRGSRYRGARGVGYRPGWSTVSARSDGGRWSWCLRGRVGVQVVHGVEEGIPRAECGPHEMVELVVVHTVLEIGGGFRHQVDHPVVEDPRERLRPDPQTIPLVAAVSYTHLRAHETRHDLVCR